MTLRKKLGSGFETLEMRAAPSTLLGAGVSLDFAGPSKGLESRVVATSTGQKQVESFDGKSTSKWGGQTNDESPSEQVAKPQAILDVLFAARSAARNASSEGAGRHAGARSVDVDTADVLNFPTGDQVIKGSSSSLRRTPNGISWTLNTSDLEAGHVHTYWVIAFNNPDACVDGCGFDDFFRPGVATTLAYGGGHVVGPNGSATFSGHLQEGDTSGFPSDSPFAGLLEGEDLGLVDAEQADIILVVRDHGEVIPGRVGEQIGSWSGGCDVNACADVQFAVHPA